MSPSERLVILGLLLAQKPRRVLELGCAKGGLTDWLSRCCDEVVTVDLDPNVNAVARSYSNVTPMCMSTQEAARALQVQASHFDLCIIDADHSSQGVRRDLENAIQFSDVIILHDTYYPPCREGILAALSSRNIYYDLDLVTGGLQPDGLWGGIGIVIPGERPTGKAYVTPRLVLYPWLRLMWKINLIAETAVRSLSRAQARGVRFVRRFVPGSNKNA